MIDETWRRFARLRPRRSDGIEMLLAVLTEPKPQVVFDRPRRAATPAAIARAATAGRLRLRLDLRSRCLYSGRRFAINGELLPTRDFDPLLATLADTRELAADSLRGASPALLAMLSDWLAAGWLHRESPGTLPDGRTRD
jgi:hypothetical protein